ncbi:DUF302 domain-containing protein [Pseudohalioglobus sediminis]|nr:DUF302 domain-containing protein [Pseudohalioglobus sediminis]
MVSLMERNVASSAKVSKVVDIDHSRLGHQAGSPMRPARVLIFSDPQLESELIKQSPLVALDLPLRVLAFEDSRDNSSKVIYNTFDYLESRYQLNSGSVAKLRGRYSANLDFVINGIAPTAVSTFPSDTMSPDGIITISSPYSFEETVKRINVAIDAQGDTMHFGTVDFQANARDLGIEIAPSYLIMFGGPGPGGKAMAEAPTLGLDGFCQKFLIWEDASGQIKLSFNDLLALAERQGVKKTIALRVINFRLKKTFGDALAGN